MQKDFIIELIIATIDHTHNNKLFFNFLSTLRDWVSSRGALQGGQGGGGGEGGGGWGGGGGHPVEQEPAISLHLLSLSRQETIISVITALHIIGFPDKILYNYFQNSKIKFRNQIHRSKQPGFR